MNLLESFKKESKTNTKVICLTPYDRDFPFIFLSIKEYLECEDLSDLWTTGFVEEFEYTYHGENRLMLELDEDKLKKVLANIDDEIDFESLTSSILKWHFGYTDDTDVILYIYNYDVYAEDGTYVFYYTEKDLVEDILKELYDIDVPNMRLGHDCLMIQVDTEKFFNDGNWHDMDYVEFKKLKIQFIDNQ